MTRCTTSIATSDTTSITVRGHDLVHDLVGRHSFTEMLYFLIVHRFPSPGETRVLDACLVTLMEHGWTPSSIITRLTATLLHGPVRWRWDLVRSRRLYPHLGHQSCRSS